MGSDSKVLLIDAGLVDLCCALRLHQSGISCQLIETSDGVGGRVRTDKVEGFVLDSGFQILLTTYPEARRVLDYEALDLPLFYPEALIRYEERFFPDLWHRPFDRVKGHFLPIGSFSDNLRVRRVRQVSPVGIYARPLQSTRNVTCLYYEAMEAPLREPIWVLNGEGKGPIHSLYCPSNVAPNYAPEGKTLVSVMIIGNPDQSDQELEASVRSQLTEWFGARGGRCRHLRTYRILHALSMQVPPRLRSGFKTCSNSARFICLRGISKCGIDPVGHGLRPSGRRSGYELAS